MGFCLGWKGAEVKLPCKKVLCAIDFSKASFEALEVANELASNFSAELLLVNVRAEQPLPADVLEMPGFDPEAHEEKLAGDVRNKLEEISQNRVPPEIKRRIMIKQGDVGHEILEAASEEKVDLIVIASHGMSGLHHYLHGSVAQRVIHHTPCAVLVVRATSKHK